MASYSVAEAKNRLPSLLVAAERGEPVIITRRGKAIVELRPVSAASEREAASHLAADRDPNDPDDPGGMKWLRAELVHRGLWGPMSPVSSVDVIRAMRDEEGDW